MSEFEPSAISDEEKEAQGISLAKEIATLRSSAKTDADYKVLLQKTSELKEMFGIALAESGLSGEILDQIDQAKEILGEDVFGPEAVNEAFGIKVESETVPPIPFSKEELERAKELGQMLLLRVDKAPDGTPLTMKKIGETLGGKVKDGGKVFYDTDWYKEEKFYTEDAPEAGWALVSKKVIPESTSKNYLEQTESIIEYIKTEGFADKPEWQEAIQEFEREKAGIAGIVTSSTESEWKEAARKLEALKINQLTRQSPTEAIYDLALHFQNTGTRLMDSMYTWTKRRSSDGGLILVGNFASDGVDVYGSRPGRSIDDLGVSFSRSR